MSASGSYGVPFYVRLSMRTLRGLSRAGMLTPPAPSRMLPVLGALRGGVTAATACALSAARHPTRTALVDERGELTFSALARRVDALSRALHHELGVGPGRGLAIMCRNHRGFVEAMLAAAKLGADVLLLNTEFPGPQLAQALSSHTVAAAVLDEEFTASFDGAAYAGKRVIAWHEPGDLTVTLTLDALIARGGKATPKVEAPGRIVILTSGTTGAPKGAPRTPSLRALLGPLTTLLSELPLRSGEALFVAPPFFHAFGLAYLTLGIFLASPVVMRRKYEPREAVRAMHGAGATMLVGVPVMLQRLLDVPADERDALRPQLRAIVSAGAPLSPALAEQLMHAFGPVLYNLYGSTETGFGAIAGPQDLRAAPGTVGRPPFGTKLRILTRARSEARVGEVGSIFLGGPLVFEGYSGGGSKETVRGLMNTGDLGHVDARGRLFVDGREDDMIVSGGENVFPGEVEDLLLRHPAVADAAVLGVEDREFGQRLAAFVVLRSGQSVSEEELRAHLKAQLARYKLPREFVFLPELPRNATGKVLRRKLLSA